MKLLFIAKCNYLNFVSLYLTFSFRQYLLSGFPKLFLKLFKKKLEVIRDSRVTRFVKHLINIEIKF